MLDKLKAEVDALTQETLATALTMFAMLDNAAFGSDSRAQMGGGIVQSVITVVVVGVVGVVGILIFGEVNSAITIDNTSGLNSSATALEDGFGSAMELLPIVLIVIVASLVISVIARFR